MSHRALPLTRPALDSALLRDDGSISGSRGGVEAAVCWCTPAATLCACKANREAQTGFSEATALPRRDECRPPGEEAASAPRGSGAKAGVGVWPRRRWVILSPCAAAARDVWVQHVDGRDAGAEGYK
ncbi:hypothetical protein V500_06683 [Pseudogymnoascus sp. VKM F-4518 (FW-2643)]|nr:hypothetical protein V500_06683 [Pseudogymnoascus sp. VKM F-4518 (FW-2643)]